MRKSHKVKNRVRTPTSRDEQGSVSSLNEAVYVALSDYRAQGFNGGLSVDKGESVHIIEKSPNGWWYCKIGDKEGWVPSSYIERREKNMAVDHFEVTNPGVPKPEIPKRAVPKPAVPKPGVKKPAVPKPNTEVKNPRGGKPVAAKRDVANSDDDYIAISDYLDNDKLNISLKEGAPVKVLERSNSGWWYVQSCGAEGWAPSTYLAEKPKEKPKPLPTRPHFTPRPQTNRPPPARPSPPARPRNIPSGQKKDVRVSAPPIPSRGKKPTLPRNRNSGSVENLLSVKPVVALKQVRSSENLSGRPSSVQYYYVIADFNDDMNDTLNVKRGDKVEITRKDEGGWWLARIGNRTGWVPSNYLEQ